MFFTGVLQSFRNLISQKSSQTPSKILANTFFDSLAILKFFFAGVIFFHTKIPGSFPIPITVSELWEWIFLFSSHNSLWESHIPVFDHNFHVRFRDTELCSEHCSVLHQTGAESAPSGSSSANVPQIAGINSAPAHDSIFRHFISSLNPYDPSVTWINAGALDSLSCLDLSSWLIQWSV